MKYRVGDKLVSKSNSSDVITIISINGNDITSTRSKYGCRSWTKKYLNENFINISLSAEDLNKYFLKQI